MRRLFSSIVGFTAILLLFTQPIHASCGSANCFLVTGTQEGIATPGQLVLDLSYRWIPMDRAQRGSDRISEAVVPGIDFENGRIVPTDQPGAHREFRTNNELAQADISYGVTERFALTLAIPFLNNRWHEHDHRQSNGSFGNFQRQDSANGFGDLRLNGKYALWVSTRHLLVGGVGVKTPTGEYKLLNHDGAINEPTIQPGTGSWDGIASVYYAYQIIPHQFDTFFSSSYQITTQNDLKYQFGNTLLLNGGVNTRFGENRNVIGSLQVNLRQTPRDEFRGREVPSTGGLWVYLTPGVKVQASPNTALYVHLQLPLYQKVNDENLVPRYGLILGISHAF